MCHHDSFQCQNSQFWIALVVLFVSCLMPLPGGMIWYRFCFAPKNIDFLRDSKQSLSRFAGQLKCFARTPATTPLPCHIWSIMYVGLPETILWSPRVQSPVRNRTRRNSWVPWVWSRIWWCPSWWWMWRLFSFVTPKITIVVELHKRADCRRFAADKITFHWMSRTCSALVLMLTRPHISQDTSI